MRSIVESTRAFEAWIGKRTDVSGRLLKRKHRRMAEGAFPFLRATFYRWVERWPEVCPQLAERDEDVLLAVGDLHVDRDKLWFPTAAERMTACTRKDHAKWAKHQE